MKEEKIGTESKKTKFIDTSIIFGYLFEKRFKEIIDEQNNLLMSTITLFEIKRKMLEKKIPLKETKEKIDFLKSVLNSIELTEKIAEKAADLSIEHNLPAADSIIYASALENDAELITADNDFKGIKNCVILS